MPRPNHRIPLLPLLLLCLAGACARNDRIPWREGPLEEALEEARRRGAPLLVDVYAEWCLPCRRLDEEVWASAAGARLARDHVAWKVDFDSEEGQAFKRRYNVLGLPTVLFLEPDGTEVDRVEGYPGRREFLEEARRYASGGSRLEDARAALQRSPEDPEVRLELGHLLLVRGREEEGRDLLEAAAGGADPEAAAEALFLLGRYFTRAAEQPGRAVPYWDRLHREFEDSRWSGGAVYWLLKSYDEDGRLDEGLERVRASGYLRTPDHFEVAASYLEEAGREEAARGVVARGLELFPGDEDLERMAEADAEDLDEG